MLMINTHANEAQAIPSLLSFVAPSHKAKSRVHEVKRSLRQGPNPQSSQPLPFPIIFQSLEDSPISSVTFFSFQAHRSNTSINSVKTKASTTELWVLLRH